MAKKLGKKTVKKAARKTGKTAAKKGAGKVMASVGTKSKIMRHEEPVGGEFPPVQLTSKEMGLVEGHVSKHVGKFDDVLHEIMSMGIHLDVLPVPATKKRPFHTFVTMGMSAVPMTVPREYDAPTRAELMVVVPPEWKTDAKSMNKAGGEWFWPVQGLKQLGRLPSGFATFLDYGHTVPNGDPAEPFGVRCPFVCWMVVPPLCFSRGVETLKAGRFKVRFMQIIPLFAEEMEYKLERGAGDLFDRFEAAELDPARLCDPKRVNVCARPKGRR